MTTAELARCTFSPQILISVPALDSIPETPVPISSTSSICTRESDALSDAEKHGLDTPLALHRSTSDRMNAAVSLRKTSRQGRASQRWITDSETNETIRLVTGCVPILQGGKILFVSANRKPEWILPKGGWEQDESMEESAVRECFEEAGVLGTLGPRLSVIQYETRKAKKRRLEQEVQLQKRLKEDSESEDKPSNDDVSFDEIVRRNSGDSALLSDEAMSIIRSASQGKTLIGCDETASTASSFSSPYSQVRMTLFPLYVESVADKWPEGGRLRKAVDIDDAIVMTESRPELRAALMEVKQRGLHLLSTTMKTT